MLISEILGQSATLDAGPWSKSPTFPDIVFCVVLFVVVNTALLVLAAWRSRRATGAFRFLFYLPVMPLVYVATRIAWDGLHDRTSHNLWPFEFVIFGVPCALLWVVLVTAERKLRPMNSRAKVDETNAT